jgi:pimeloyl-ACP methyl ester carboxylesterase
LLLQVEVRRDELVPRDPDGAGARPSVYADEDVEHSSKTAARPGRDARPMGEQRWVQVDGGDMHVTEDGDPGLPAILLLTNAAAPTDIWDPVIPTLAGDHHVIRVNPHARGSGSYDVPTQARDVAAVLDRLGVGQVTLVGHSSGAMVSTAIVEHRRDLVAALVLIDMSPDLTGKVPDPLATRLLQSRSVGRLLWRLRTEDTIRKAAASGFTRPVEIPEALVQHMMQMKHEDLVGVMGAYTGYLGQRSLADRLAGSGLPLLVLFGTEDGRWRPSSAAGYRVVPGVRIEMLPGSGHMPMMEDPDLVGRLLLEFAAAADHPN